MESGEGCPVADVGATKDRFQEDFGGTSFPRSKRKPSGQWTFICSHLTQAQTGTHRSNFGAECGGVKSGAVSDTTQA